MSTVTICGTPETPSSCASLAKLMNRMGTHRPGLPSSISTPGRNTASKSRPPWTRWARRELSRARKRHLEGQAAGSTPLAAMQQATGSLRLVAWLEHGEDLSDACLQKSEV
jgi:hypothetical protein